MNLVCKKTVSQPQSCLSWTQLCQEYYKRDIGYGPDQMPRNAVSGQGLQCLHLGQEFLQNMVAIKTNQTLLHTEMDWFKELLEESSRHKWVNPCPAEPGYTLPLQTV